MEISELRKSVKAMGGKLAVHRKYGGMRKLVLTIYDVKFETDWFDAEEEGNKIASVAWKASALIVANVPADK